MPASVPAMISRLFCQLDRWLVRLGRQLDRYEQYGYVFIAILLVQAIAVVLTVVVQVIAVISIVALD
jgi:hypothetical protein